MAETSQFDVDGVKLHVQKWPAAAASAPKGTVVVVHGFCDHAEWYSTFAGQLSAQGYEVIAFDQRGYGKSAPNKKDYSITNEYYTFNDLDHFAESVIESHTEGKLFLLGHSMGGAIVLNYMAKGLHRDKFDGYISLAPLIELHPDTAPGRVMRSLLSFMAKVAPRMRQGTGLKTEFVSHDKDVVARSKRDDRRKPIGCYEGVNDMLARGKRLNSTVFVEKMVNKPLLVCHGDDDHINAIEGTRKFYNMCKVSDKTMLEYPGYYHELHNENEDRQIKFVQDVLQWLGKHADGTAAPSSAVTSGVADKADESKTLEPPVKSVAEKRPSVDEVQEEATEAAVAIGTPGAVAAAATGSGLPEKHNEPELAARGILPSTEVKEEMAETAAAIGTAGAVGAAATGAGIPKPHPISPKVSNTEPKEEPKAEEPKVESKELPSESPKEPESTPANGAGTPKELSADDVDVPLKKAEAEEATAPSTEEPAEPVEPVTAVEPEPKETEPVKVVEPEPVAEPELKEAEVVEPPKVVEEITKPEEPVEDQKPVVVEVPKQPEEVPEVSENASGNTSGDDESSDKVDELTPGAANGQQTVSAKPSTDSVKKNKNKNKNKNKKKKKGKK